MKDVRRTEQSGQTRLVAVLAVVLGLLAMHGLASTHHAAAAGVPAAAGAALVGPDVATAVLSDHQHAPTAAAASGLEDLSSPVPGCLDGCPVAVTVLCVVVLAVTVAASVLVRRPPRRPGHQEPSQLFGRAPAIAQRRPATPDPVAELCVSRT